MLIKIKLIINSHNKRRDKAQLMRDTSDNKKKLIRELNTLSCHSVNSHPKKVQ